MPSSTPRRSPPPQERQRDPARTRKLILDAAATEFAAHGYMGARISAIAARAGVNQQLISYYFNGKEGLHQAIVARWQERENDLAPAGTPLAEQIRGYALEALHNPDGVRMFAWSGLQYAGPGTDPDQAPRAERMQRTIDEIRAKQQAGDLPAELDPACLTVMLVAAAMATTTLPHVIDGVCQVDSRSPEFIEHYANQVTLLTKHLGFAT